MAPATTKRDLIKRPSAETSTPRQLTRQIVQQFLNDIVGELASGHRLKFRDFGVFEITRRKPRVARNPRTGASIHIPAKTVAHFKQGRLMRERVAALEHGESQPPPETAPPEGGEGLGA